MSDMENRVRDAFEAVHLPTSVRNRALQAIEAKREHENSLNSPDAADVSNIPNAPDAPDIPNAPRVSNSLVARDRIRRTKQGTRSLSIKIAIAASLLLALVGTGGYLFAFLTPTAYMGIDVNPSIELAINRFDRVVETTAYSDDGQAVLNQAQVKGLSYIEALDAIETAMTDQGFLEDDAVIEVSIVCDSDDRYDTIESVCLSYFENSGSAAHCSRASSGEHHEATSYGIGMGKYRAYQALVAAGVDIELSEASSMTMRELYDLANSMGVDVQWGCGSDHGDGHGSGGENNESDGDGENVTGHGHDHEGVGRGSHE